MKKNRLYLLVVLMAIFAFASCGDETNEELDKISDNLEELADQIEDNVADELEADKFYSNDGKFKISFSGEPTFSKENVPTEAGDFDMFMYIYEEVSRAEMMAYIDYPPEIIEAQEVEVMLQNAKEGSVSSMGLVISEEKEFTFKGNKAVQFRADNNELYVDYLLFLVGNRFFQTAIMVEGSYPSKDEVKKFYDSIEILN